MDRLPWSRFHWLVLFALGITWVLDGLEVTLIGAVSGVLENPETLHLTSAEIGLLGSSYVLGAVLGALLFGYMTDRWGRKRLFFITLAVYLGGVVLSAFSWNVWSFAVFRFLTGAGIGGEYAAINSAVDELIPARVRGRVDLIVNATYWLGAALGAISTVFILNPKIFPINWGWRLGFAAGGIIGLGIIFLRRFVPESPRWLILKGREKEAEKIVSKIEREVVATTGAVLPKPESSITVRPHECLSLWLILKTMFHQYRHRSLLGLCLMVAQAFLYNAIFFTYALVLTRFYQIPGQQTGLYLLPFALGNFLGPVLLGHLFDTVGRKKMIAATYAISALLLAVTGYFFFKGVLSAVAQTALWTVIFFFASSAASSAYLTVSEIFPLETRGMAIAIFYALGTGTGGVMAPWLFGTLIGTGSRELIFFGYLMAALLMMGAAIVELVLGVNSERKSLEEIAKPICAVASS